MDRRYNELDKRCRKELQRLAASGSLTPLVHQQAQKQNKKPRRFATEEQTAKYAFFLEKQLSQQLDDLQHQGLSASQQHGQVQPPPAAAAATLGHGGNGNRETAALQTQHISEAGCSHNAGCGCAQHRSGNSSSMLEQLYLSEEAVAAMEQVEQLQSGGYTTAHQ